MPSRSEAGAARSASPIGRSLNNLFKVRAQRAPYRHSRSAPIRKRSASRKSIRSALRADFEQTAPPSLREGSPPNLGGDWSPALQPNQVYITSTTFKPLQGAPLR